MAGAGRWRPARIRRRHAVLSSIRRQRSALSVAHSAWRRIECRRICGRRDIDNGAGSSAARFDRPRRRAGIFRADPAPPRLAASNYRGPVQLLSSRGAAVLAHVKHIGEQTACRCCRRSRSHRAAGHSPGACMNSSSVTRRQPPAGSISMRH